VLGRLAPGVAVGTAQAEMTEIARQLEEEYPQANSGRGVFVEPLLDVLFGNVRMALYVLLGAVGLLLLIACANVTNLLLARGSVRSREVAVRAALGANGGRLTRQFLVETLLLAGIAGVGGILLAKLGLARLVALTPPDLPRVEQVGIDLRVLAATMVVGVLVAVAIGLVPTLQARRLDVQGTLKADASRGGTASRSKNRFRAGLVVAELALSVVLLVGAGLLVRSFLALRAVDPGFRAERVLKVEFSLPDSRYPRVFDQTYPNWPRTQAFYQELLSRLGSVRGVESAALAGSHPLAQGFTNSFVIIGREQEAASLGEIPIRPVSAGYFNTLGVQLLRGRALEPTDGADAPAVGVINEAAARRFFPDTDPLGQRIRFWGTTREIVGVVANERFYGLAQDAPPGLYTPLPQTPIGSGSILVRGAGEPEALVGAVRDQVRAIDPELALFAASSMERALSQSVSRERFTMLLLAIFAGIALVMAILGVHGVLSYSVSQRKTELWIRMALGATRGEVVGMVVRQGMALAALGIGLGLLAALASTRLLASLLFGVSATDALTLAAVAAAIALAALAASYFPARRAV
jgi:predicted permease